MRIGKFDKSTPFWLWIILLGFAASFIINLFIGWKEFSALDITVHLPWSALINALLLAYIGLAAYWFLQRQKKGLHLFIITAAALFYSPAIILAGNTIYAILSSPTDPANAVLPLYTLFALAMGGWLIMAINGAIIAYLYKQASYFQGPTFKILENAANKLPKAVRERPAKAIALGAIALILIATGAAIANIMAVSEQTTLTEQQKIQFMQQEFNIPEEHSGKKLAIWDDTVDGVFYGADLEEGNLFINVEGDKQPTTAEFKNYFKGFIKDPAIKQFIDDYSVGEIPEDEGLACVASERQWQLKQLPGKKVELRICEEGEEGHIKEGRIIIEPT